MSKKLNGKAKQKARKLKEDKRIASRIAGAKKEAADNKKLLGATISDNNYTKVSFEIDGPSYGFHSWAFPKDMSVDGFEKSKSMQDVADGMIDVRKSFPTISDSDARIWTAATYLSQIICCGAFEGKDKNKGFGFASEVLRRTLPTNVVDLKVKITSLVSPARNIGGDPFYTGFSPRDYVQMTDDAGIVTKLTVESLADGKSLDAIREQNARDFNAEVEKLRAVA